MVSDMFRSQTPLVVARRRTLTSRLNRREAVRLFAAVGLTAVGAARFLDVGGTAIAARGAGGGRLRHHMQDMSTPIPGPQLGLRPDGTRVWQVRAGGGDDATMIDGMAFLPDEITINAGDSISFEMPMPHTVTFLAGREAPLMIATMPALEGGAPMRVLNPDVITPSAGDAYDGNGFFNSGMPLDLSAPPITITFTTPGNYDYLCLAHPVQMKGTVIVQKRGAALPYEQDAYDDMAAAKLATLLDRGRALVEQYAQPVATQRADGTTLWEISAGAADGETEVFRFLPDKLAIAAGDTVRWVYRGLGEPHTVTFLGGQAPPDILGVAPQNDGMPLFVLNRQLVEPAGGAVYDGAGFANSGFIGQAFFPSTEQRPSSYELTFSTPGDYPYYCAMHGGPTEGMIASISVSARA
jgi:plastocyanin